MSFTDVLPTDPVIPTTGQPSSRRQARARRLERGERIVGGQDPAADRRSAVPSEERARSGSTTTPQAPASSARAANSPPSARSPRSAEEEIPRAHLARVDDRPLGPPALRRRRRLGAGALRRSALGTARSSGPGPPASPRAELLPRHLAVVEGDLPPALELLALLVALAGDHDRVARRPRSASASAIAARRSGSTSMSSRPCPFPLA